LSNFFSRSWDKAEFSGFFIAISFVDISVLEMTGTVVGVQEINVIRANKKAYNLFIL